MATLYILFVNGRFRAWFDCVGFVIKLRTGCLNLAGSGPTILSLFRAVCSWVFLPCGKFNTSAYVAFLLLWFSVF